MERQAVALARLLRPRSVAIVGVSPEPGSIGGNVLGNLTRFGFHGDIHLVSRSNREIDGRRCVGSIDELPDGVDAAVLAVPRQATVEAITGLRPAQGRRRAGVRLGLCRDGRSRPRRAGGDDADRQRGGLALCGPNCIGFVNIADRVALTFEPLIVAGASPGGGIGVVTQSGAMCSTLRLACWRRTSAFLRRLDRQRGAAHDRGFSRVPDRRRGHARHRAVHGAGARSGAVSCARGARARAQKADRADASRPQRPRAGIRAHPYRLDDRRSRGDGGFGRARGGRAGRDAGGIDRHRRNSAAFADAASRTARRS